MTFLTPAPEPQPLLPRALTRAGQQHLIWWASPGCILLIVFAACGQSQTAPGTHSTITAQSPAAPPIYLVTFTASTTYQQAHDLLEQLRLEVGPWDCSPQGEAAGEPLSAALVPLTTPPPSQDTPEHFAQTHGLIVGYWEPPEPDQLAQLRASPLVHSVQAIPLRPCQ
jgi:hypothetical protein